MTFKLPIGVLPSEAPFNGTPLCVSCLLPGIYFGLQCISIGNASIQTLAPENSNFDLRHV